MKVEKTKQLFEFDKAFETQCAGERLERTVLVGGCDEAGRGPLAGPLVCAACVMNLDEMIDGVFDSKGLSEKRREILYSEILKKAISYHVSIVDCKTIDEINILNATKLGMARAINGLSVSSRLTVVGEFPRELLGAEFTACDDLVQASEFVVLPDIVLVDAVSPESIFRVVPIIKGDAKSYNIAAASIIAKVARDRIMRRLEGDFPAYGFSKNKGYGTAEHVSALREFGACAHHRKTFIKNFVETEN